MKTVSQLFAKLFEAIDRKLNPGLRYPIKGDKDQRPKTEKQAIKRFDQFVRLIKEKNHVGLTFHLIFDMDHWEIIEESRLERTCGNVIKSEII